MTVRRRLVLAFRNKAVVGLGLLVVRAGEDVKVPCAKVSIPSNNQGLDLNVRAIKLKFDFLLPSLSVYTSMRASASTYRSDLDIHCQLEPLQRCSTIFSKLPKL
jgi:hypothetical protein